MAAHSIPLPVGDEVLILPHAHSVLLAFTLLLNDSAEALAKSLRGAIFLAQPAAKTVDVANCQGTEAESGETATVPFDMHNMKKEKPSY